MPAEIPVDRAELVTKDMNLLAYYRATYGVSPKQALEHT